MRQHREIGSSLHLGTTTTGTFVLRRLRADLDIKLDEDDPHAILSVVDERGEVVRRGRASTAFKLTEATVRRFIRTGDA